MSSKPCANCKKTVYVNEKIDAEGRWYHRGCFKCMAPDCTTSLTLRTFQMAAIDDSVTDPLTERPLKVLVCKDHVPMPKHSLNADSLAFKHTTSAPKPSIAGLHQKMMGDRITGLKEGMVGYDTGRLNSPRSLDQGSHAEILKGLMAQDKGKEQEEESDDAEHKLRSAEGQDEAHNGTEKEEDKEEPEVRSMQTTTLPKFQQGRFTVSVVSDPMTASHVAAEEAQDPTKDDDSFRNIPVRHSDYDHKVGHASKEAHAEALEDYKQERVFTMNDIDDNSAAEKDGEHEEKLGDLAFSSKLMKHKSKDTVGDSHMTADDDEWDAAPMDDFNRGEPVAGM